MGMAPNLQASLMCDDVRQERSGKFILIGLFDVIAGPSFPLRYPQLFLVNRWCSGEGEFTQQTRILAPDQSTLVAQGKPILLRLPSPEASATHIEVFLNLEFRAPGVHWVEILLDDDLALRYPLRVAQARPAAGAPPGETPH